MNNLLRSFGIISMVLAGFLSLGVPSGHAAPSEEILVGRVVLVEGMLLRYVQDSKDWVAVVKDAPFGLDDALYSDENTHAEFSMPNRMRIRIGSNTQIQMIALKGDLTSLDVASGTARFINDNDRGMFRVSTPYGYVVTSEASIFDLHVGDGSVEVAAFKGTVDFVQDTGNTRYSVKAGAPPLISDGLRTTTGEGGDHAEWYAWNDSRDEERHRRLAVKGESVKYLPEGLHDEAHILDEYGNWEPVRYKGEDRHFWRPTGVASDYEPFTAGRWTLYHGDNVWMPDEPFGYVTHHYGNWIHIGDPGYWCWMPPVPYTVYQRRPSYEIAFSWFPGRVVWTYSSAHIGWIPLTPFEHYYANRYWGPRTIVVRNVRRYPLRISRFQHFRRAVIIDRRFLYDVNDYRPHRIRGIRKAAFLRDYRAAPVLSSRILSGNASLRHRHNFRNVAVTRIPTLRTQERIDRNRRLALTSDLAHKRSIERQLRRARRGALARDVRLERPTVSRRLVSRDEVVKAREESARKGQRLQRERRERQQELRRQSEDRRQKIRQERARSQRLERQRREAGERRLRLQRERRDRQQELRRQSEDRRQKIRQERARSQRLERQRREAGERRLRLQRERRDRQQELRRQSEDRRQKIQQERARSQRLERQRRESGERRLRLQRERRERQQELRRQREDRRQKLPTDKNALAYGRGGAIGNAVARAFPREGAEVFRTGRTLAKLDAVAGRSQV